MSKQKLTQKQADWLQSVIDGDLSVIECLYMGICGNLNDLGFEIDICASWPKAVCPVFPIAGKEIYDNDDIPLWEGKYLELRQELCQHILNNSTIITEETDD